MIDVSEPGSPGWWLSSLEGRLVLRREGDNWMPTPFTIEQRRPLAMLEAFYKGEPPLPQMMKEWPPVAREYLRQARVNLAELCVSAGVRRMRVAGFRTEADDDADGDQVAADIYRFNRLGRKFRQFFTWGMIFGESYMMVTPNPDDRTKPYITPEHPFNCITDDDEITGKPRAALKILHDETMQQERAYLFLPGRVYVAVRSLAGTSFGKTMSTDWEWSDALSFTLPADMADVIPVRKFENENCTGEFEPHLDTLVRINTRLFLSMMISEYQAFSFRILSGAPMIGPDGKQIDWAEKVNTNPGNLTVMGANIDEDSGNSIPLQLFESKTADIGPLRMAIADDVKMFAAATSTPLHLVSPDAAQGSAEGASTMREGGTDKAEDRRERGEEALAEIMGLAFRFAGNTDRTNVEKITVIWGPSERFSLAEKGAAAAAFRQAGVPLETVAEEVLQMSPDQIERMNQRLADEALRAPVTAAEQSIAAASTATQQTQEPVNVRSKPAASNDTTTARPGAVPR